MPTYFERRYLGTTEYFRHNDDGTVDNWLRMRADPTEPKWGRDMSSITNQRFERMTVFFEGEEEGFIELLEPAR